MRRIVMIVLYAFSTAVFAVCTIGFCLTYIVDIPEKVQEICVSGDLSLVAWIASAVATMIVVGIAYAIVLWIPLFAPWESWRGLISTLTTY